MLRLVDITAENLDAATSLRVSPAQQDYVASVAQSLEEATASPEAGPWYRSVYVDNTPVGFVMLGVANPPRDVRFPFRYFLWRLLIDERFQGRGYGRQTLDAVVSELRTHLGADVLFTTAAPGDSSPIRFYENYGFMRTTASCGPARFLMARSSCAWTSTGQPSRRR